MDDLIEQIERADGASDELDAAIWRTIIASLKQLELIEIGMATHGEGEADFRTQRMMDGFTPTASIDAAMSLVPEGHTWRITGGGKRACVTVVHPDCQDMDCPDTIFFSEAATPALALCAAALKARAYRKTGEVK